MYTQEQLQDIWNDVLGIIQIEASSATFHTLFKNTILVSIDPTTATVGAPSAIVIDLIKKRFHDVIKKELRKKTQSNLEILYVPKTITPASQENPGPLFVETKQVVQHQPLQRVRPDYTFETIAVSSSNQLAFVSATTVAKNPGKYYNPLFIYGPVGVGKTHLMHAIANAIYTQEPTKKILYKTSEEFTNEVVEAIRTNQTQIMKKKFRTAYLLMIDDVQFLEGKERVQEELFHTFNILIDNQAQIVLSSDRPPTEIKKLEKRLSSRFAGGLSVDIQAPDFELRTAILLIKSKKYGVPLTIDSAKIIAEDVQDARRLEGTLLRCITEASTSGKDINELISNGVIHNSSTQEKKHTHAEDIVKYVCDFYDIKPTQIKGPKRTASLAYARQVCMYLLKKELELPLVEIGNILGGRDHTTIMHGVEKIESLLITKQKVKEEISGITQFFS